MTPSSEMKPMAMTHIVCGVVIEKDGKYLLVQEKQPKAYGLWNLPAGRVDQGETLEQAAKREAKEECGLDVEVTEELLVVHPAVERPVLHAFGTRIVGGEVQFPQDEILAVGWFTYEQILAMTEQLRAPDFILPALEAERSRV